MVFRVGQKVVCVKKDAWADTGSGRALRGGVPSYRQVLTIRQVVTYPDMSCLLFDEIVHKPRVYSNGVHERNFMAKWFRPLITKTLEQDSAMFQEIADSANTPLVSYWDRMNEVAAYGGEGVGE